MICSLNIKFLRSRVSEETDEYLFTIDLVERGIFSLVVSRCVTFPGVDGPTRNTLSDSAEVFPRKDPDVSLATYILE